MTISPRQLTPERLKEIETLWNEADAELKREPERRFEYGRAHRAIADLLADRAHLLKPVEEGEIGEFLRNLDLLARDFPSLSRQWSNCADIISKLAAQLSSTQGKLEEATTLAKELLGYVPDYFIEKWRFDEQVAALSSSSKPEGK